MRTFLSKSLAIPFDQRSKTICAIVVKSTLRNIYVKLFEF